MIRRNRVSAGAVALAVAMLSQLAWAGSAPSRVPVRSDGGAAIPDDVGVITEITLHYDPYFDGDIDPFYEDLFEALPADVAVTVICPSADSTEAFEINWGDLAARGNRELKLVNACREISVWARDRYISRQSSSLRLRTSGFVPKPYEHYEVEKLNDLMMPDLLWEASLAPTVLDSPILLEGGNLVANRRHVFIGVNVLEDNAEHGTASEIRRELRRIFGRQVVLVGDPDVGVPWCHTDMYLTPLTDRLVLVGSPEMAAGLLDFAADQRRDDVAEELLHIDRSMSDELQMSFDAVADQLRRKGYKVGRLPAVVNEEDAWMITYNNVLVESREGRKIVYMPTYGVEVLDSAAEAVYEGHGFTVKRIDVSGMYTYGGALRCMANVTERRIRGDRNPAAQLVRRGGIQRVELSTCRCEDAGQSDEEVLRLTRRRLQQEATLAH